MAVVRRRLALAVLGWTVAAAAATGVGVAAVDLLGAGITDSSVQPLSQADVQRALSRATATPTAGRTATPAPTRSAPATPSGLTRVLSPGGGIVLAHCAAGQVSLLSWSPAPGFRVGDDVVRGPAPVARLEFRSHDADYAVSVTCDAAGRPVAQAASIRGEESHEDD